MSAPWASIHFQKCVCSLCLCAADDAQRELDAALPALDAALASLKNLSRNDVVEVRSLQNPPQGVKLVMEAACIMFDEKPKMKDDPNKMGKSTCLLFARAGINHRLQGLTCVYMWACKTELHDIHSLHRLVMPCFSHGHLMCALQLTPVLPVSHTSEASSTAHVVLVCPCQHQTCRQEGA